MFRKKPVIYIIGIALALLLLNRCAVACKYQAKYNKEIQHSEIMKSHNDSLENIIKTLQNDTAILKNDTAMLRHTNRSLENNNNKLIEGKREIHYHYK